ncbi:MAG: sugar transferase [Trichodesmium sp. MAG_R02]|nr:sugar transferase [Trichodesmium sp. MAG_R02]
MFYQQARMGLKGRHFKVWKFRTMVINADQLLKELEGKNETREK